MAKSYRPANETERAFIKAFDALCYRHNPWTVWTDFINMSACAISNAVDRDSVQWANREKAYMATVKKYSREECQHFTEMTAFVIEALEENPAQDFLGNLYMNLNFGSNWAGQFFTPWHVAEMMAQMNMGPGLRQEIASKGFISVSDPCCGAGCMLLAFAHACKTSPFVDNYQSQVLFVAQDLDRVVALMCYIQLSLLGCPGYVVVGNTLTHPVTGTTLRPIAQEGTEIWFTPMWFTTPWTTRVVLEQLTELFG